jgi:hypothetical protein
MVVDQVGDFASTAQRNRDHIVEHGSIQAVVGHFDGIEQFEGRVAFEVAIDAHAPGFVAGDCINYLIRRKPAAGLAIAGLFPGVGIGISPAGRIGYVVGDF